MASTKPEQSVNMQREVRGPSAQQKSLIELSGAETQLHNYLSAMTHNSFTMANLLQSSRDSFALIIQDHLVRHQAYQSEWQKNQTMAQNMEVLRNQQEKVMEEINRSRITSASIQNQLDEANAVKLDLMSQLVELKSELEESQCFAKSLMDTVRQQIEESVNSVREPQAVSHVTARQEQNVEDYMQRLDAEIRNDVQESSSVVEGMAMMATVVQGGGVMVESSAYNSGLEASVTQPYDMGSDQVRTPSVPERNKGRSRLRRQKKIKQLTLDVPGTDS